MDIENLPLWLRDPDPRVRVEALRILAMVEETRALEAIRWIYMNDPEPGVREVANWAGRLVWMAHQRGYSTQRAMEEMFARPFTTEHQERFLESLSRYDLRAVRNRQAQTYASEQTFRRQLDELLRQEDRPTAAADLPRLLPPLKTVEPPPAVDVPDLDGDDLLDAGLSDDFWEDCHG
jgi:hypothetical protein